MKNFNTLTAEELRKVYNANRKLREKVFDDMQECARDNVREYLDCWFYDGHYHGINFSIGYDRGDHFESIGITDFIKGLEIAQSDYGFLADEYNQTISYIKELRERMNNLPSYDYKNEERIETRIDELIEELEKACLERMQAEYEWTFEEKNCEDYFVEFFVDERLDGESMYVDDEWKLFQRVQYEKCYA